MLPLVSDVWALVLWERGGKDCGQAGWEDSSEDSCLQGKKCFVELRAEMKRWQLRVSRDKCLQREASRSGWGAAVTRGGTRGQNGSTWDPRGQLST